MIIECARCNSKVDATVLGDADSDYSPLGVPCRAFLVKCPVCSLPMLGESELEPIDGQEEWEWVNLERRWPEPQNDFDSSIPEIARTSLTEARICFKAKAYIACAVMVGRAIEGVCVHHGINNNTLAAGLKQLKDNGIIDDRMFKWGEELRRHRNIGAHASEEKIPHEDAKDLLDFALAICDYVFVLNTKFERFQQRVKKRKEKDTPPPS